MNSSTWNACTLALAILAGMGDPWTMDELKIVPRVPFRFTPENARIMAERSKVAREKRKVERAALVASAQAPSGSPSETQDVYVSESIARVRERLKGIDAMMALETDPLSIERLARASAALAERERILSGRPLPGSRRPGADPLPVVQEFGPL